MGRTERKFDEKLLLKYKDTNEELLFNQIMADKDIKKYVSYVCNQKLKHAPTTLYSFDDFFSLAYLILWQSIHKYKFICPCCKLQAKTMAAYKIHTVTKHDEFHEPHVSISRYLKFNLGVYLQNEIRREYTYERRTNVLTINIFSPDDNNDSETQSNTSDSKEFEIASEHKLENEVVFNDSMETFINKFDPLTAEIFEYLYIDRLKQIDIAAKLFERGRYSSEQSAAVVVSRIVKNKINPALASMYPEIAR